MEALIFNNNFGLCSNLSEPISHGHMPISVFIMKIVDINNNARNSKLKDGEIRARVSQLFNQVRTKVRTKIMYLMLVAKREVSTQVSTEKVRSFLLAGNKLDTGIQFKNTVLVDTKADTNLNVRSKCAPKTYFLMRTSRIFRHVRREFCETIKKENYLLGLANFSRQTAITQAEKFVPSFFACSSICLIKSWGKRIFFNCDLLFLLPVTIVNSLLYKIRELNNNKKVLTCLHTKLYIGIYTPNIYFRSYKTITQRVRTSMGYLTQPLNGVMIMANRYDSAHLCARQSKVYKFYDLSTAQVVQTIATTERQARKNLGKQSLIFIARKQINSVFERSTSWGGFSHA